MSQIGLLHADRLGVSHSNARADRQRGELIDRVAAGAPVCKLFFVEAFGDIRVLFARHWPDHGTGVELTAIDAHRAAEAVADLKSDFNSAEEKEFYMQ